MRRMTFHLFRATLSDSFLGKEAGREAPHQADDHGTRTLGTPLQNHPRSTPPQPVPSGLNGEAGAEAHGHRARFRGAAHDRAALAEAISGPGRARGTAPLGPRADGAHSRDVGAHDPGLGARRPAELWARSRALDLLRAGHIPVSDHRDRGAAHGPAGLLSAPCHPPLSAHVPLSARRPGKATSRTRRAGRVKKKAQAGACVLLSQDEARFPLVPTLHTTLGVKGYRPMVGTWDNKDQVYCLAALNLGTGQLTTRLLEQPARNKSQTGHSKQQRLQGAFAAHLQDIARRYPATTSPAVVITIDNAPWHRGARVEAIVAAHPHLRLYRLPSYSPQRNVLSASGACCAVAPPTIVSV